MQPGRWSQAPIAQKHNKFLGDKMKTYLFKTTATMKDNDRKVVDRWNIIADKYIHAET